MPNKILIVDDEAHIRILLERTLEDFEDKGVEILTAQNGKEALGIIFDKKPDLIFLDIMMPEIDGYEVCAQVKKENEMKEAYIIMLTAKGQGYDQKRAFQAGADTYMTKPFDPDAVIKKVSEVLDIKL